MRFIEHITKPHVLSAMAGSSPPGLRGQEASRLAGATALVMGIADFGFLKYLVVGSHRKPFPRAKGAICNRKNNLLKEQE